MEWLNYHHLLYFWMVARTGSVTAASKELGLTPPTVSAQVRQLEESIGEQLFRKRGRRLVLTDMGQVAFRYADEIFGLGRELVETLRGQSTSRAPTLHVGISDLVPKLISHRILEPLLELDPPIRLVCREGKTGALLASLATHELDVVLADEPTPSNVSVRAYNHLLGTSGVTFFARPDAAENLKRGFPESLSGHPMLLPMPNTPLRRSLDTWFARRSITPRVVAEFEDTALLKVFGEKGAGAFAGPTAIAGVIAEEYGVVPIGETDEVRESFYAITAHRRLQHPAVVALSEQAKARLF